MADKNRMHPQHNRKETFRYIGNRGGGQPKPRTPSGQRKSWTPPSKGTTPADRTKDR